MRKLPLLLLLVLPLMLQAGTITQPTVYSTGDQVTATNLNNNIAVSINEINGGLDNNNADVSDGFRFYEVKGALPAAGTQGRTVFLTTDNTLYFDNGSSWSPVVTSSSTPAQGDIVYYDGSGWVSLVAGTANTPLVTNGAGADPAFEELGSAGLATDSVGTDEIITALGIKGWALVETDGTLLAGYNAASARNAAGKYTITWGTNFADANYVINVTPSGAGTIFGMTISQAAGSCQVGVVTDAGNFVDRKVSITAWGAQ